MVGRTVTFDRKEILATLLYHNVDPEFACAVLAFNFIALVLQKFDDLLLE